MTTHVRSHCFI